MILLCGIRSEPPMQLALAAAERLGAPYRVFDQRECSWANLHLAVREGRVEGALQINGADWPLASFTGVYARMMDYQDLPGNRPAGRTPPDPETLHRSRLFHQALDEWLEVAECRVMNRSRAMASNASKPYQAQLIARAGFRVPPTLVTNDPAEVRCFLRTHGRVVYKSVSAVRSIVKVLDAVKLNELGRVRYLPTQFQAFVPGTNVRVHVVGEAVFATEIQSEAVDYRYAHQDGLTVIMRPTSLPPEVAARCCELSRQLDLPLCGIDLKRTAAGDYYCFEVNPSPAYSYYQEHSGQDIAGAIIEYLR